MENLRTSPIHFLYKHPLFRAKRTRQGIWYESSPYYLWWRFLRHNDAYKEMRLGTTPQNATYAAFKDIHAYDDTREGFAKWFRDVGEDLFCEPKSTNVVKEITADDDIAEWMGDGRIVLSIPVSQNAEWAQKQVKRIVSKHRLAEERRKELGKPQSSSAQYQFAQEPDVPALKRYLEIYELHIEEIQIGGKIRCRTYGELGKKYFGNKVQPESAKSMAFRMVKTAKQIIQHTINGEFPKFSVR
jgi:hypothetical protein